MLTPAARIAAGLLPSPKNDQRSALRIRLRS